jgi:hypothetical protein
MQITKTLKRNIKISNSIYDFKSLQKRKMNDVEYMKNLNNLPKEIKNKVLKAIVEFPPQYTECISYSQYIASSVPFVKIEMGLYIYKDLHKNVPIDFSQYDANSWVKYEFDDFSSTSYIDENKEVWGIHCWNSYNGIHFDCMKDSLFKIRNKQLWVDYKQIKSVDFQFPTYQSMIELKTTLRSLINYRRTA